ncbi:hypothetical protein P3L10_012950 [Capsicum annuum]
MYSQFMFFITAAMIIGKFKQQFFYNALLFFACIGLVVHLEQIELDIDQCNESEASPNDIIGKLFGAEHSVKSTMLGYGSSPFRYI